MSKKQEIFACKNFAIAFGALDVFSWNTEVDALDDGLSGYAGSANFRESSWNWFAPPEAIGAAVEETKPSEPPV